MYLILILPFFLSIKFNYSNFNNELCFTVNLLSFIKLLKGKILLDNGAKIIVNNKCEKLSLSYLKKIKNKSAPLKDYHIYRVKVNLDLGEENSFIKPLPFAFISNTLLANLKNYLYYKKPYLKIKNNINNVDNSNIISINIKLKIVMNLLMILTSVFKILGDKIINAKTTK